MFEEIVVISTIGNSMLNMLCLPFYVKYLRSCIIAHRRTTMLCAKNKHLGQTGDRQFFLIRPPWQGLVMHWPDFFLPGCPRSWSPIGTYSMHDAVQWPDWTSLFVHIIGFSTSQLDFILSPASWLLSVTSSDAFVQWSLGRHGQGLQIDSGKSGAVRAHDTTSYLPTLSGPHL